MINYDLLKKEIENLGIEVDSYAIERFDSYAERLIRWNEHVNLTSITDPDEIVIKHFIDSLALLKYVDIPSHASVIDVGTGAGFPGMPVLIAKPSVEMTFIDSLRKRLGFIKDVLRINGLVATVHHTRAEDAGRDSSYREQFDFATARAVAPLNVLCEYCLPLVKIGGSFVALKGANADQEISEAAYAIELLGGKLEENHTFTLPNGDKRSIVIIKKISQTPTKYPRKSKKIDTRPL